MINTQETCKNREWKSSIEAAVSNSAKSFLNVSEDSVKKKSEN